MIKNPPGLIAVYVGALIGVVTPMTIVLAVLGGGQGMVFLPLVCSTVIAPVAALYLTWLMFKPMPRGDKVATGILLGANVLAAAYVWAILLAPRFTNL